MNVQKRKNNYDTRKDIILLHNVCFSYKSPSAKRNSVSLLQDTTLTIKEQQSVGLIGGSGTGKSTLALIAAGLLPPSAGRVFHCGVDIYARRLKMGIRCLQTVQMLFQNPFAAINPRRKIKSWLRLAARYSQSSTKNTTDVQLVELLELVGLQEKHLSKYPSELSGGECQKVCLATCLVTEPKCIILDEPTTMLDNIAKKQLLAVIHEIQNTKAVCLLVISHDLVILKKMCDTIYFLDHGQLVAT